MSPSPNCLLLEVTSEETKVEIRLSTAVLDETNAEAMRSELAELAKRLAGRHVSFHLGNIEFVSSTWLGLFVSFGRELRAAGGRMTLHEVRPEIYDVFAATRLTDVLDVRRGECLAAPKA